MPRGKHQAKRQTTSWVSLEEIRNLLLASVALLLAAFVAGANAPSPNSVTGLPQAQAEEPLPFVTPTGVPQTTISRTIPSVSTQPSLSESAKGLDGIGLSVTTNEPKSMPKTSNELSNSNQRMRQPTPISTVDVNVSPTTRVRIHIGPTTTTERRTTTTTIDDDYDDDEEEPTTTTEQGTTTAPPTTTTIPPTTTTIIEPTTTTRRHPHPTNTTRDKKHKDWDDD